MQYFDTPLYVFMPIIFFIYGMSFFMLGITVLIERLANASVANRLRGLVSTPLGFLALFGITHGLFEFFSMYSILDEKLIFPLKLIRLLLLSASFYFLCRFGTSFSYRSVRQRGNESSGQAYSAFSWISLANVACGVWIMLSLVSLAKSGFSDRWFSVSEIFSRYFIGAPGAIMAAIALWSFDKEQTPGSKKYRIAASLSFALYAAGVMVVPSADFFPASFLNYETFYRITHVPTVVLRTLCAVIATFSLLRLFRLSKDFSGIRFKAIMHVMIAVAIPTFCIIVLVCYLTGNALLRLSYREHERLASVVAGRVNSVLDDAEESVKYSLMFSRSAPALDKKNIFISVVKGNAIITGMAFIDEEGEILRIYRDPASSSASYRNAGDNARINKFLEGFTLDMPANNFYVSGSAGENVIISIPMKGKRIEVLLDIHAIYETGTSLVMGKRWHFLLLDDNGGVILPKEKLYLREEDIRSHIVSAPGIYRRKTIENGTYYNVIEGRVRPTGWSVIIEIPRSDIVAPIFGVFKALLLGVLMVNISAVVVAVLFVGKVTRPINLIAERVKSIGAEDFAPALNVTTHDELQTLSEEVEKMAVLLAEKKEMDKHIVQTEKIASLGRLVAGVAHEINNPLGIILGYSQLLQRECEPQSRISEDLKTMEKHTLTCKKIVEDLLKFSRADKQINVEVDITTSIRETLSLVEKHFSKQNVTFTIDSGPVSPKIMGDPDKLRQVFLNLALNALDAMNDGGSLTIAVRPIESEGEKQIEITFKDTGHGITRQDMGKIFDPFFTTKEVGKGTGLGLSVSYGIVKDHGGRIWAESKEGEGAIFHILFPALNNEA